VTCREFADFLAEYIDGELPVAALSHFEHHLSLCPNCRRYLDGYRATVKLGKAAFENPSDTVPADVPDDLVDAILAARARMR
jgi:anti-sigma factor RsiW